MLAARPTVVCLALALLACVSDQPERAERDVGRDDDPSTGVDVAPDAGNSAGGAAALCSTLQNSAQLLLESHGSCALDEDCRDEAIVAPCPAPVSCSVFVRKDTDLLWSQLAQLEATYRKTCGKCAAAKCGVGEPTRAYCDASKHCAARKLPPASVDASTPRAPAEAGLVYDASASDGGRAADAQSDAGGVTSPYACKVNLDCVITNVGNCCGYYPRCANVNATFAPPDCSGGQAGVCGFPSIDSCACRNDTCVSLQGGQPI